MGRAVKQASGTRNEGSLPRFFVSPNDVRGATLTIDSPQERHHIQDVLRLGVGDRMACFDGTGAEYLGVITRSTREGLVIQVERRVDRPMSSRLNVWLAQGLSKTSKKFE